MKSKNSLHYGYCLLDTSPEPWRRIHSHRPIYSLLLIVVTRVRGCYKSITPPPKKISATHSTKKIRRGNNFQRHIRLKKILRGKNFSDSHSTQKNFQREKKKFCDTLNPKIFQRKKFQRHTLDSKNFSERKKKFQRHTQPKKIQRKKFQRHTLDSKIFFREKKFSATHSTQKFSRGKNFSDTHSTQKNFQREKKFSATHSTQRAPTRTQSLDLMSLKMGFTLFLSFTLSENKLPRVFS